MTSDQGLPVSSGAAYWPQATPFRAPLAPLAETLEAEFNIAQLRALARTWDIRLKGASRSGFIAQVAAALAERVARMRDQPDALLEGLSPEQALFARRLLTARDHELPVPRSLAAALWADRAPAGAERGLAELFDSLRRRALIFPTLRFVGYRDVYYQWLPLAASGGNVPVVQWESGDWRVESGDSRLEIRDWRLEIGGSRLQAAAPITTLQSPISNPHSLIPNPYSLFPNFLDAFDLFIHALLTTGVEVRAALPPHPQAAVTHWLRGWEHDAADAELLLNSRPGWVPDPRSGIRVPLLSALSPRGRTTIENQTGLPAAQCEFLFAIACALQLVEAPDPLAVPAGAPTGASSGRRAAAGYALESGWRLKPRMRAVEEWLSLTDAQRLLRAWEAWQERITEGVEAAHAAGRAFHIARAIGSRELGPLDLAAEWCALRRYVARALRGLPAGTWIAWDGFQRALHSFHRDCAWTLFNQDHWWFAAPGSGFRLAMARYEDWAVSAGATIEVILRESLRWFGVVEVDPRAAQTGAALRAFRVTELGDWLLRAGAAVACGEPAGVPPLPVAAQPRPRVVEPAAWLDGTRWRLPPAPERAELIALSRQIGQPQAAPFTYQLTPASIENGLLQGVTLELARAQFERLGAPMPEAAQALYQSVAERFGRVRVYEALTIVQMSDDYALRELLANTALDQAIVCQISPRAVVVRPEAVDALVQQMVERGYTPSVIEGSTD